MTGKLDSTFRPLAVNLISDFGSTATWTRQTSTFDPSTGKTTDADTSYSVVISPPAPYNNRRVDGTVIQVGDTMAMLAAEGLAFTPTIGDYLTHKTIRWQVVGLVPIYSGELISAYEVQLRK